MRAPVQILAAASVNVGTSADFSGGQFQLAVSVGGFVIMADETEQDKAGIRRLKRDYA